MEINEKVLKEAIKNGYGRKTLVSKFGLSESDARSYVAIASHAKEIKTILGRTEVSQEKAPREYKKRIKDISRNETLTPKAKVELMCYEFECSPDLLTSWLFDMGIELVSSQLHKAKHRNLKKSKRYIISSAQSACMVNDRLLKNMEVYAKFIDAEIGVIATRYRNPTSIFSKTGEWWPMEIDKYLIASRQNLHPYLSVLADVKVQATSPNPLAATELMAGGASTIIGAPKIAMKTLPSLGHDVQKFTYSTGSISYPSFTDTAAGAKAKEHHSFGFMVVEIESDRVVHMRSVACSEDGFFNDLKYRVENGEVSREEIGTLVWGDSHFAQKDERITIATRKLCKDLGIRKSVLHDVFDSKSLNVHNINNPIVQHELAVSGEDDLDKEISNMLEELNWFEENMDQTIVVNSNHDDMLTRSITSVDWRNISNPNTQEMFVSCILDTIRGMNRDGVIAGIIDRCFDKVCALGLDSKIRPYDVELAMHGHKGANGAKGSIKGFSRLPFKSIIGHSHSPAIEGGCYQVGMTCKFDHDYNKGASSWAWASCTLNKHGKRQMIVTNRESLTYTTLY